jgi:hypothetical protein
MSNLPDFLRVDSPLDAFRFTDTLIAALLVRRENGQTAFMRVDFSDELRLDRTGKRTATRARQCLNLPTRGGK